MKRILFQSAAVIMIAAVACAIAIAKKEQDKSIVLPANVKNALAANYPNASVKLAEKENEQVELYEAELVLADGQEADVKLAPDGTIMEYENKIDAASMPFDLSKIVPQGAKVITAEKAVTYAVLMPVILEQPDVTYELTAMVDGKEVEIKLSSDGQVLNKEVKDDDDEDEDDDDVKVSINQLPAAVKAAIEAQGGTVGEIELETEDGHAVYDVDVTINGEEFELTIAEDGKILSKEAENDNDQDNDEEDDD